MRVFLPSLFLLMGLVLGTGPGFADDEKNGHGPGGARADHASEQGQEKGKAWAGSKEKKGLGASRPSDADA